MKKKIQSVAAKEKRNNIIIKLLLWAFACFIFNFLDYTYKLLWFQYAPLIITFQFVLLSNFINGIIFKTKKSAIISYMKPIEKNDSKKWKFVLYCAWELLIILVQFVVIVLQVINTSGGFFDKAMTLICGIIMAIVAYASLTGQGSVVFNGSGEKKRRSRNSLNPTQGMEYVPGVNAYRDSKGNYYSGYGTPIATPVSSDRKDRR